MLGGCFYGLARCSFDVFPMPSLVAALVAYGAVFQVPNADPRHDGEQDQEDGYRGRHRDVDPRSVLGLPADDDHDL